MQYKNHSKNPTKPTFNLGGKRKTRADEEGGDELDDFEDNMRVSRSGIYHRRICCNDYEYHLDSNIQAPAYYRDLFHCMGHMSKDDEMAIYVDSSGGRLDAAQRIIQAIQDCEGNVVVIGAGLLASAAAMIFLQAPQVVVTKNSSMMLHSCSFEFGGKEGEIFSMARYSEKMLDKLTSELYEGFLSEQEIKELKIGRDFYFDSDEIIQRLEARAKYQEVQQKKIQADIAKVEKLAVKSTKAKKVTKK
jgi:hypothetical protein